MRVFYLQRFSFLANCFASETSKNQHFKLKKIGARETKGATALQLYVHIFLQHAKHSLYLLFTFLIHYSCCWFCLSQPRNKYKKIHHWVDHMFFRKGRTQTAYYGQHMFFNQCTSKCDLWSWCGLSGLSCIQLFSKFKRSAKLEYRKIIKLAKPWIFSIQKCSKGKV